MSRRRFVPLIADLGFDDKSPRAQEKSKSKLYLCFNWDPFVKMPLALVSMPPSMKFRDYLEEHAVPYNTLLGNGINVFGTNCSRTLNFCKITKQKGYCGKKMMTERKSARRSNVSYKTNT
ncbi:hypothetical protein JTB14_005371 [Gonioctena quinquepunctata]|nr:hypothetical protein JTB14_005371 [Gonioctena quinquepunctata]